VQICGQTKRNEKNEQTHEVLLRFCRTNGLFSMSAGMLFSTESCECTRNAKFGLEPDACPPSESADEEGLLMLNVSVLTDGEKNAGACRQFANRLQMGSLEVKSASACSIVDGE
jgi:hypothetical protein